MSRALSYTVFHRTWYPRPGRKTIIARNVPTADAARDMCRVWNANHVPKSHEAYMKGGGRKAEFDGGLVE